MNKTETRIPFNRPFIVGKELFYISQAVLSGHLAGDGKFTKMCQNWMEERFGALRVMLTTSCTSATEMCAMLTGVQPGDEVIMPSFTFVSTANAFVLRSANIRFVDVRTDTLNIDEKLIEAAITERTKLIVPMHYGGVACDMDAVMRIAAKHDLLVVEDAAQGVDATYKGKYLGTIGHLGAYSFHETKNFICGEGGALVINDERFIERAEVIREKGTNRSKFFRGEVDKYSWIDIGSSYLPSELVAAFLYAQLEESDAIVNKRWKIHDYYAETLQPIQERGLVKLPYTPPECRHNAHMFYLVMRNREERDGFIRHLNDRNIHAVFHYLPLHSSPMGLRMGYKPGDLPVTEDVCARVVRLPCYFELSKDEQNRVVDGVKSFFRV